MAKPIAIFKGVDSGGTCPCVTPPTALIPSVGNVYANKVAIIKNGSVLTSVSGITCSTQPVPCTSARIAKASGKVFISRAPAAKVGDFLNLSTNIRIPTGSSSVFV